MAKDRNTPALFEVFGRTPTAPSQPHRIDVPTPLPPPPRVHVESIAPDTAPAPAGPSSPRIIRLPIGYIYVGLAVVVLLIVGSYFVGVSRGRQQALAPVEETGGRPPINDPTLNQPNPRESGASTTQPPGNSSPGAANRTNTTPQGNPAPVGPTGRTLDRDTRQSGLNYIIVERFDAPEAWAVKEFLKRNGIDVLVLADNNNRSLLQVVTAQGFKGWASDSAAQSLYRKIQQLGSQWKAREGGSKDFSQSFPKLQK